MITKSLTILEQGQNVFRNDLHDRKTYPNRRKSLTQSLPIDFIERKYKKKIQTQ